MTTHQKTRSIYIAGPLFSEAELCFNRAVKEILKKSFDVYLPQEDGELLDNTIQTGGDVCAAIKRIFHADVAAIKRCDTILVILDGRTIDEGAAFELGVAYTLGKTCLGLQTDPRRLLKTGNNPMIAYPIEHVFSSLRELEVWAVHQHHFREEHSQNRRYLINNDEEERKSYSTIHYHSLLSASSKDLFK